MEKIFTEEKGTEKRERKQFPIQLFCMISGSFAIIVQIVAIGFYMAGVFSVFGRNITVVSASNLILQVFNLNKATLYRSIFGMLIGVLYYVLLGIMCKCLFVSFFAAVNFLFRRTAKERDGKDGKDGKGVVNSFSVEKYFKRIAKEGLCTFEMMIIFLVTGAMVTNVEFDSSLVWLMVAFGVVALSRIFPDALKSQENLLLFIPDIIKVVLLHAALCVMSVLLKETCVKEFFEGCSVLFNNNLNTSGGIVRVTVSSFYFALIAPILSGIVSVLFLRLSDRYCHCGDTLPIMRKLLIFLIVIMGADFLFRCLLHSVTGSVGLQTFTAWLSLIKNSYLPMLFISVLFLLLGPIYNKQYSPLPILEV